MIEELEDDVVLVACKDIVGRLVASWTLDDGIVCQWIVGNDDHFDDWVINCFGTDSQIDVLLVCAIESLKS